ncbi:MAG: tRNA preQ1(34) S-adenosylmethionine ribosyltransferase-isomerase QueA [Clostridiales bacterium]|nr:tRNA preQ1(34) S-adenosylmethionine ribosyltransferase-isomerase QueA [Clostridiales bacterium]
MRIDDFDYNLPPELIAQYPAEQRDHSRLLVVHRDTGEVEHRHFYDILDYLNPGDCLVMNNSKVLPARLYGVKQGTGAKVEFLLTKRIEGDVWESMVRPGKRLKPGDRVTLCESPRLEAEILDFSEGGTRTVRFEYDGIFLEVLDQIGRMPLPPYIERESEEADKDRYQTVYCKEEGSVAAPTAGLHFTKELLEAAKAKGVNIAEVTLHVGIGTFRPVKCENIEDHHMHFEEYTVSQETADLVNATKKAGGRIIAVGTTSTRTLESASDPDGTLRAETSGTDIFIYPGYKFKVVDSLITNFHLPKSTLMMLISAFYDREEVLKIYNDAVARKYRFFSYGDASIFV